MLNADARAPGGGGGKSVTGVQLPFLCSCAHSHTAGCTMTAATAFLSLPKYVQHTYDRIRPLHAAACVLLEFIMHAEGVCKLHEPRFADI